MILKNHSQLEDLTRESRNPSPTPVGHVYTLLVEELNITNPDIKQFIKDLKDLQEKLTVGRLNPNLSSATEIFDFNPLHALSDYLVKHDVSKDGYERIMLEAGAGSFPPMGITDFRWGSRIYVPKGTKHHRDLAACIKPIYDGVHELSSFL